MAAVFLINEKVTIHTFLGGTLILAAMFLSEIKVDRLKIMVLKIKNKSSFKQHLILF